MGRRIVVFADGTGNSAAKAFKTNVWRLYEALDLSGGRQLAVFADGVGTSGFKPFAILGLALGFGVKRRVLDLYKFLCLNFEEGDEIYVFGFSRGAFIARILVGLICRQGLVSWRTQEELDSNAVAAYRAYRVKAFPNRLPWVRLARWLRDRLLRGFDAAVDSPSYDEAAQPPWRLAGAVRIRFLGLWDTVAAYGLPVEELTRAVNKWVWPLSFANHKLLACVDAARQAFSLDDERRTFFPIPFNESDELTGGDNPRLRQVWFAGSHSNVGGGYPDDRLAHVPLCWMIGEAASAGLEFRPEKVAGYLDLASESGRVYDSRANVSLFYRYHPRSAKDLMGRKLVKVEKDGVESLEPLGEPVKPLIDGSVFLRMIKGGDDYASVAMPADVSVLTPQGRIIPFGVTQPLDHDPDEIPKPGLPDRLPLPKDRQRDMHKLELRLRSALNSMRGQKQASHTALLELVKDTVWWRRVVYFAILAAVVTVLAFPLLAGYLVNERLDQTIEGVIGPVVGLLGGMLPSFLLPWLVAITNHGYATLALASVLAASIWLNAYLRRRIGDRAAAAWKAEAAKGNAELAAARLKANRRKALFLALTSLALSMITLVVWTGGVPTLIFGLLALAGLVANQVMRQSQRRGGKPPAQSLSLKVARWIRTNGIAIGAYVFARDRAVPLVFLLCSAYLGIAVVNKATFELLAASGNVCAEPVPFDPHNPTKAFRASDDPTADQQLVARGVFRLSDPCWDSGVRLDAGVTYAIKLNIGPPWADRDQETDTRGFTAGEVNGIRSGAYYFGSLFKRWWGLPWFKTVARIGRRGNEEYALEQLQPERKPALGDTALFALVKPRRSGALFLYVNDAVIGVPGGIGSFYGNNRGTATLEVERLRLPAFDKAAEAQKRPETGPFY